MPYIPPPPLTFEQFCRRRGYNVPIPLGPIAHIEDALLLSPTLEDPRGFSRASDSVDAAVADLKKTLDEMDWSRSFQGETVGERRLRLFPEMQDPRSRKPAAPGIRLETS